MNVSRDVSPRRPLLVGVVVGLVVGLILGLIYAWQISPAVYAGGAQPHELSSAFQQAYVGSVAEGFMTNVDVGKASRRLQTFSVPDKVRLLADVAAGFSNNGLTNEASGVVNLAQQLKAQESWSAEDIASGLSATTPSPEFAQSLGQVAEPVPPGDAAAPPADSGEPAEAPSAGRSILRTLLWFVLIILVLAIAFILLTRIKLNRPNQTPTLTGDAADWDGTGPQPLRQWVGTYTFGQDNYDESFTVETQDSDFLGECGMGIMDGFAGGSPKRVMAFDVWLFDKTDIRTVSMPIMSNFAFEDDNLRAKLPPDATPVLASEGQTFDIETTALVVKAKIDEVVYGDEAPENGYFTSLKVSLTAYLKPDVDVSGFMPIPEGMDEA